MSCCKCIVVRMWRDKMWNPDKNRKTERIYRSEAYEDKKCKNIVYGVDIFAKEY